MMKSLLPIWNKRDITKVIHKEIQDSYERVLSKLYVKLFILLDIPLLGGYLSTFRTKHCDIRFPHTEDEDVHTYLVNKLKDATNLVKERILLLWDQLLRSGMAR